QQTRLDFAVMRLAVYLQLNLDGHAAPNLDDCANFSGCEDNPATNQQPVEERNVTPGMEKIQAEDRSRGTDERRVTLAVCEPKCGWWQERPNESSFRLQRATWFGR